jgi:hypothetical protein
MSTFIQKIFPFQTWQLGDDARISVDPNGRITGTSVVIPIMAVEFEKLSSAATPKALAVDKQVTLLTSTGIHAGTLANGVTGRIKEIYMVVDGGDFTLTPANFANGTTITFNDAGDYIKLIFDGTNWNIVQNAGCTIA